MEEPHNLIMTWEKPLKTAFCPMCYVCDKNTYDHISVVRQIPVLVPIKIREEVDYRLSYYISKTRSSPPCDMLKILAGQQFQWDK